MKHLLKVFLPIIAIILVILAGWFGWKYRTRLANLLGFSKQSAVTVQSKAEQMRNARYWIDLNAFAADPNNGFTPLEWPTLLQDTKYDFVIAPPSLLQYVSGKVIVDLTKDSVASFDPTQLPATVQPLGVKVMNTQLTADMQKTPQDWVVIVTNPTATTTEQAKILSDRFNDVFAVHQAEVEGESILPFSAGGVFEVPIRCASKLQTCLVNKDFAQTLVQTAQHAKEQSRMYRFVLDCAQCSPAERLHFSQLPVIDSFSVVDEGFPSPTWKVDYPSSLWSQSAFSMQYNEVQSDNSEKPFWKSGIVGATNTADWFIPVKQPSSSRFTSKLQLWLGFSSNRVIVPLTATASFTHTFSLPEIPSGLSTESLRQAAWIPEWGHPLAIESLKRNAKYWDEINPVWYIPQKNGSLKAVPVSNSAEVTALAKQNNIRVVPSFPLFDTDVLAEILNKNLDAHVAALVKVAQDHNYAGIELDYESTYAIDKEKLVEFVTKLADALHAKNKTLTFTALPKWSDGDIYSFLPQTHQAQDWQRIGAVVDEFRIMAYDFTAQGNTRPGPLSPLLWNDLLLKYAVSKMPKEKVVLALPLYSHSWAATIASLDADGPKDPTGPNNDQSIYEVEKQTYSFTGQQIQELSGLPSYNSSVDAWNREMRATYKDNGTDRTMYYLNKDLVNERAKLAAKYQIRGLAYWRLGGQVL